MCPFPSFTLNWPENEKVSDRRPQTVFPHNTVAKRHRQYSTWKSLRLRDMVQTMQRMELRIHIILMVRKILIVLITWSNGF